MIVKNGYCKGLEFILEGPIESVLGPGKLSEHLAVPAALQALTLGGYNDDDAPFYYGKVNHLGYIISHHDLYE